jgi:hypothetical protein
MAKLYEEQRAMLLTNDLPVASSVSLTSDIWSGNGKEDYISVVCHYVNKEWDIEKKVVGFSLINCKHTSDNIADSIANVVEDFGLSDKVFAVTLNNASANAKAYKILGPIFLVIWVLILHLLLMILMLSSTSLCISAVLLI